MFIGELLNGRWMVSVPMLCRVYHWCRRDLGPLAEEYRSSAPSRLWKETSPGEPAVHRDTIFDLWDKKTTKTKRLHFITVIVSVTCTVIIWPRHGRGGFGDTRLSVSLSPTPTLDLQSAEGAAVIAVIRDLFVSTNRGDTLLYTEEWQSQQSPSVRPMY